MKTETPLTYNGAWYMNVTEKQSYGTYSDYYTEKKYGFLCHSH